ncbi:hypothetical protein [Streptomyces afghaniensis]|uniref:hypothetical protein n=1 Tax=Streptomyces afghaniensis TaxID=66865 RepID=UPI0027845080|nr:hypothetical protein [Streptomyces afghaniensis]MDQ1013548.1 ABC-type uncharacterized transport system permease subunit [Streptomyces afghaniensis]
MDAGKDAPPPDPELLEPGRGERARDRIADWFKRPVVTWLRRRGIWVFLAYAVLWGATACHISVGYATQFMIGAANPFHPPICLTTGQQALAISLRLVGWILVPATVGASAGLIAAAQLRSFFGVDAPAVLPGEPGSGADQ